MRREVKCRARRKLVRSLPAALARSLVPFCTQANSIKSEREVSLATRIQMRLRFRGNARSIFAATRREQLIKIWELLNACDAPSAKPFVPLN